MINRVVLWLCSIGIVSVVGTMALPATYSYAACGSGRILTLRPWYDGLVDGDCNVTVPSDGDRGKRNAFIWKIVLNLVEDALQIAAYVSFGFLVYGGFQYMISSGSPDKASAAQKTIINSIVGLIVSIFAVLLVSVVANTALGIG